VKVNITNLSSIEVPVTAKGEAWIEAIAPTASKTIDKPGGVWVVGSKQGIVENIRDSLGVLVRFITQREQEGRVALELALRNDGPNAVRIVPGNVANESELPPGASTTVQAIDYVQLAELGNVTQMAGSEAP
jgi:hypothetical protein